MKTEIGMLQSLSNRQCEDITCGECPFGKRFNVVSGQECMRVEIARRQSVSAWADAQLLELRLAPDKLMLSRHADQRGAMVLVTAMAGARDMHSAFNYAEICRDYINADAATRTQIVALLEGADKPTRLPSRSEVALAAIDNHIRQMQSNGEISMVSMVSALKVISDALNPDAVEPVGHEQLLPIATSSPLAIATSSPLAIEAPDYPAGDIKKPMVAEIKARLVNNAKAKFTELFGFGEVAGGYREHDAAVEAILEAVAKEFVRQG